MIPGVSSVHALTARHRIPLNRVGRAVMITPARLLADGMPAGVDDVVVMLDAGTAFTAIDPTGHRHLLGRVPGDRGRDPDQRATRRGSRRDRFRARARARGARLDLRHLPAAPGAVSGRVLILGGTAEARALAAELVDAGVDVVSSLAGRVARPRLPVGEVRIGGFGGPEALAPGCVPRGSSAWLTRRTRSPSGSRRRRRRHPRSVAVPLLRLERPGWSPGEGDDWRWVDDLDEAAAALGVGAARVLDDGAAGVGRVRRRCGAVVPDSLRRSA